jgi:hypothetical protein
MKVEDIEYYPEATAFITLIVTSVLDIRSIILYLVCTNNSERDVGYIKNSVPLGLVNGMIRRINT